MIAKARKGKRGRGDDTKRNETTYERKNACARTEDGREEGDPKEKRQQKKREREVQIEANLRETERRRRREGSKETRTKTRRGRETERN